MPAPTLPTETIDDDEGFDWEAAVREIDAACTINSASTSNNVHPVTSVYCNMQIPAGSSSRQSTLDHFLVKPCPRSSLEPFFEANVTNLLDNNDERPCCVDIDPEAAKTWIYPVNVPLRDYQFSITKTALFSNTLVALPTGLGKTLIAAVVMYNFFRWFPEGKIVFAAPSRPLVMQQIEACHNIVGIPLEWTIDMTGQTSPGKRAFLWKSKRVFFVTPQVFEKDIQSGTCMIKNIVCLVVDEAHRAMGNYAYSVAVRELMAAPLQLRILALSATPGSKQQTIQQIIDNLHISMLEYRNESDPDVSPYVHNRKLDLIVVPMGKDADEINNLLSEVIRPFVTKLSAMGVLQYRDFQNLSPCELLNARDKFRLARPPNVPELRCREIEGYFGVLITLYHIRKLLSSHGIMPAYEMLEDKLHQSSFARLMSRNEDIHKAKLLMQKCISHGAPSPKLSKLTDVLVDHFKSNNPQSSRVIIFSNFRGSVRDIMNTLGNIGEHVKATEFIGQSAGKILKGQSQKVQQAVLEKFRAGGYNVIVATSIGEEGLDIMEVDLVICFDANISPLRMIQRMGRTGRKNDGRVVVLACEGSEVKGYMRKQAKSKTLGKHMQKGGLNSFRFHSSPRMIPHVFKPEVQLVELSIEQFVRRGRTVTDDHSKNNHTFSDNLTDNQIESITKYFHPDRGNRLRLSLIAFPHFQAFSSRVHKVIHSFRTGILIDSMRQLQEIPVSIDGKNPAVTDEAPADQCVAVDTFGQHAGKQLNISLEGNFGSRGLEINTKLQSGSNILDFEVSSTQSLDTKGHHNLDNLTCQNPPTHSFLFGSEFVSVDANGMIQILSVPFLSMEESPTLKYASTGFSILLNSKEEYLTRDYIELTLKSKDMADSLSNSQPLCAKTIDVSMIQHSSEGQCLDGKENVLGNKSQIQLVNDTGDDIKDTQHSPGLTNLIKSGVVPESPLSGCADFDGVNHDFFAPNAVSPTKFQPEGLEKSSPPNKTDLVAADLSCGTPDPNSPKNVDFHSAVSKTNSMMRTACGSPFLTSENMQSPFDNLTGNSCCKDWLLSSAEKSESAERRSKFKRLRKFGDSCRKSTKRMKLNTLAPTKNVSVSCADSSSISKKHCLGNREEVADVRTYLEDEAEISSDACISDDEEDEEADSFDESFIDDRINPTAAGTQAEAGGADMMAIYRRSLLSQSPMVNLPNSPRSVTPSSEASGNESYSGKTCSLVTPLQTEPLTCKPLISSRESDFRMEILKRKRSFLETRSTPVMNLTKKFLENEVDELSAQHQVEKTEENGDLFYNDDHFYASIDLDAVEAQATILFKKKTTDLSLHKQEKPPDLTHNLGLLASPSFDLGI